MSAKLVNSAMAVAGMAIVGGLLWFALAPVGMESAKQSESERSVAIKPVKPSQSRARKGIAAVKPAAAKSRKQYESKRGQVAPDWYAKFESAADRELGRRIQQAQDDDDREKVFEAAEDALASKNAEVRQAAVDALSLQETAAIPLLEKFIGDADRDTADAAVRAWDSAVDMYEDENQRATAVFNVTRSMKSAEHVSQAVGKLESLDRKVAVRAIIRLADSKDEKVQAAIAETYENVTGEPWRDKHFAALKLMSIKDEQQAESSTDN